MQRKNENISISEVRLDEIMIYEFVKNIYCQEDIPDIELNNLLGNLYWYLDKKLFNYIDTDRDIIDIQAYIKLTYKSDK